MAQHGPMGLQHGPMHLQHGPMDLQHGPMDLEHGVWVSPYIVALCRGPAAWRIGTTQQHGPMALSHGPTAWPMRADREFETIR